MENKLKTKIWHVDNHVEEPGTYSQIVDAARLLRAGEVVAFPTETVYGLGANALSQRAVEKIFAAKGRPGDNPLIVHISDEAQLSAVVREIPEKARQLMNVCWPGPLTLILPKQEGVAGGVTAGLDSVGVRMPAHPIALALIRESGVPVAAPSANLSGKPSPTNAKHVLDDLNGRIAGVIDGGSAGVGVESTVIDMTADPPMILRPGGVTREQIEATIGRVALDPAFSADRETAPRAPGLKYTHYAPSGEMWLVSGNPEPVREQMAELLQNAKREGRKTGVLATEETGSFWEHQPYVDTVLICGSNRNLDRVAQNLFACLRRFDELGVEYIVSPAFTREGIGLAVMNRLEKAAGGRVLHV